MLDNVWYTEVLTPGVDDKQPCLYEWRIEGVGVYIGQCENIKRPRSQFGGTLFDLLNRLQYGKSQRDASQRFHQELRKALGIHAITLTLLENVRDKSRRNQREREVMEDRRKAALQGGLPVLN